MIEDLPAYVSVPLIALLTAALLYVYRGALRTLAAWLGWEKK